MTEHTQSFAQLVTSLCAILGGVITAAGLLDSLLYAAQRYGVKDAASFVAVLSGKQVLAVGASVAAPAQRYTTSLSPAAAAFSERREG